MSLYLDRINSLTLNSEEEEEEEKEKEDRISSLPDGVICHILSFLPSPDSVGTSILSKRFYPLWRSVSSIFIFHSDIADDPDETPEFKYSRFCNFVLSLLLLRDITQPIKNFTLHYTSRFIGKDNNLDTWLRFVLQRGVEHLCVSLHHMTYPIYHIYWYDLPFRTLACRTLVVLDLRGFVLHSRDVWLVELPLLKVLRLNWVKFAAEECLPQLLSGCPILEDFAAMNLKIDNDNISSDKLLRARIEHMRRLNLRRIRLNLPLQLQVFYNVGDLDLLIERVPPDYNSRMKLTFYQVYRWQWLIGMLNHSPQLQIFELDIKERYRLRGEHHDDNYDDDWLYTEFVPGCVSLSLRECTIHCYEGAEGAPQFARYIMQNASVLHTMRIRVRGSEVLRFEIEKELSLCQKRSAACQLVFS